MLIILHSGLMIQKMTSVADQVLIYILQACCTAANCRSKHGKKGQPNCTLDSGENLVIYRSAISICVHAIAETLACQEHVNVNVYSQVKTSG